MNFPMKAKFHAFLHLSLSTMGCGSSKTNLESTMYRCVCTTATEKLVAILRDGKAPPRHVVEHLLKCGANPFLSGADSTGLHQTAISVAAEQNNAAVVEQFCESLKRMRRRSDHLHADNTDEKLNWALRRAVLHKSHEAAIILLNAGADANNVQTSTKRSILMDAIHSNDCRMVKILLSAGAKLKLEGQFYLHFAVKYSTIDITRALLQSGVSLTCRDYSGLTPLATALKNSCINEVEEILNAGADPNECGSKPECRPLYIAISYVQGEQLVRKILTLLIKHGLSRTAHYCALNLALKQATNDWLQALISEGFYWSKEPYSPSLLYIYVGNFAGPHILQLVLELNALPLLTSEMSKSDFLDQEADSWWNKFPGKLGWIAPDHWRKDVLGIVQDNVKQPKMLQALARVAIRHQLLANLKPTTSLVEVVEQMELPQCMKAYVLARNGNR